MTEDPNEASADPNKASSAKQELADFLKQLEKIGEGFKDFPERGEKMMTSIFSATDEYLSKFITIGYASFFAIWALIRGEMTGGQAMLTAFFMLISVGLYVLNEIVSAIHLNTIVNRWTDTEDKGNVQERLNNFTEMAKGISFQTKIHRRVRPWVFRTMIVFALLAIGTMLYAIVSSIWMNYLIDPRMVKT